MLQDFLSHQVFAFLLIFCRVGTGIMVLPGIGEAYVMPRARLLFALSVTLVMTPMLQHLLPPIPTHPLESMLLIVAEILTGLFIGGLTRMLLSAIHSAGTIIALQSGLASSMMLDITQGSQTTIITNLLGVLAVVLLFATDMHHVMLKAIYDSYAVFTPGQFMPMDDVARYAMQTMSHSFAVAMQLAAPHVVIGIILYLAAGVLSRLMPSMQIFFILMSPQIMISFFILMAVLGGMMTWYMDYIANTLADFVNPSSYHSTPTR